MSSYNREEGEDLFVFNDTIEGYTHTRTRGSARLVPYFIEIFKKH